MSVLIKGGHEEGDALADALIEEDNMTSWQGQRIDTTSTHGTGCTLASGIAFFLAEGATLAYRLGLLFPERFGGVISMNGVMPRQGRPLFRLPQLRALRVFIGHGIANVFVPLSSASQDHRLLYTAGLDVRLHTYPTTHRLHADMLRDIDRWIMERVNAE